MYNCLYRTLGGEALYTEFENCTLCPRNCKANRNIGEKGFCGATNEMEISKISLHFGEEPVISGKNGSGTIFFTHCSLGCIYCQNFEISKGKSKGKIYSAEKLAEEMLLLQEKGAHNINFVTPTHYMPIVYKSVKISKAKGLKIPTVYNTSGFEKPEIIKELSDTIDIFLTDFKYFSPYYSGLYSKTEDYFDFCSESIKQMIKNVGNFEVGYDGTLKRGVIIRHLMLPTLLSDTKQILKFIAKNFKDEVLISLMRQYTPVCENLPLELKGKVSEEDYIIAANMLSELGLSGFLQEKDSVGTALIPKWDK